MLDQASLKLLLRARAELIAAMFLIGERIRQKQAPTLLPALPAASYVEHPGIPIKAMAASAGSYSNPF